MNRLKIYLDTSVINFLFAHDAPEKREITKQFFENLVKPRVYQTYISRFVIDEILNTPTEEKKQELLKIITEFPIEVLTLDENATIIDNLSEKYILNKVVPANKKFDALRVATCIIENIDYLVSWNYKHLANVNRERKFTEVNKTMNYDNPFRILTPENLFNDEY